MFLKKERTVGWGGWGGVNVTTYNIKQGLVLLQGVSPWALARGAHTCRRHTFIGVFSSTDHHHTSLVFSF